MHVELLPLTTLDCYERCASDRWRAERMPRAHNTSRATSLDAYTASYDNELFTDSLVDESYKDSIQVIVTWRSVQPF